MLTNYFHLFNTIYKHHAERDFDTVFRCLYNIVVNGKLRSECGKRIDCFVYFNCNGMLKITNGI